ncbi:MAG: TAXI family TRAP transporter solute-binding subunit, partial [Dehalococcoidales bacterium]|nr:TAXI family TRAP transporter solute-binding subunit [Dehalococcoidales bacterium]
KTLFRQNVGVDNIWQFSSAYGWYFGPNEDADRVYGIVKAWYEHPAELLAISSGFDQFAKLGLEMNVRTIDSMPDIPVHPGVAKYLKEKGVWKSNWKIGELSPRKK